MTTWVKPKLVAEVKFTEWTTGVGEFPTLCTASHFAAYQPTCQPRTVVLKPATPQRPLLIIDDDSFAHRSYHALPKTIRRRGNKRAGAILGSANFLLRLYDTEKPRAVLVG
jgi:hypothetical protein